MGERLLCKQEVIGSIPFTSTTGVWRRSRDTVRGKTRAGCCLKGEERVCHVTEADRPRPPDCDPGGCACPKKCLHARPLVCGGVAPVRGGVTASSGGLLRRTSEGDAGDQAQQKGIWWMPWH